ncbi:MAG: tRNA uridine-5-carboxymethylaminomethyl(34) synthesis GTPase MnmE, partial [Candidatus Omnitrophica bacterium]|nr:tRNA uridine-5-carboxymethylaminomethyl(34) synthesis GTPase MnmE [Candidatus Omnitrophota bacterium]
VNKRDLPRRWEKEEIAKRLPGKTVVYISALQKVAIDELEEKILASVLHRQDLEMPAVMISNLRHVQALKSCVLAVSGARALLDQGVSFEFVSEETKRAIHDLDRITGRNVDEDLLERIFSEFCIGK